jgi:hypothetical protein
MKGLANYKSAKHPLQQPRNVDRVPARAIGNLVAATGAVGDDERVLAGSAHFRQQGQLGHLHRDIVVRRFVPEAAPYAARRNGSTAGRGFCDACHKSHFVCPASHDSGVVLVSKPIRMAISAEIAERPFKRERTGRETHRGAVRLPQSSSRPEGILAAPRPGAGGYTCVP